MISRDHSVSLELSKCAFPGSSYNQNYIAQRISCRGLHKLRGFRCPGSQDRVEPSVRCGVLEVLRREGQILEEGQMRESNMIVHFITFLYLDKRPKQLEGFLHS